MPILIELPQRKIPDAPLRPKRKQDESPLELERPEIDSKEPELFSDG